MELRIGKIDTDYKERTFKENKNATEVDKPVFPGLTTWSCIGVVARGTVFRSNGAVWEEPLTYAYRALSSPTMDT